MPLEASPFLYSLVFLLEYKNMVAIWICQVTSSFASYGKGSFDDDDDDDEDDDDVVVVGGGKFNLLFWGLPSEHLWIVIVVVPSPLHTYIVYSSLSN